MENGTQATPDSVRPTDSFGPLLDFFSAKCNSGIEDGGAIEYCTSENTEEMVLPTPPPEAMASPYSYELQDSSSPQRDSALVEYQYIKGSSLEETPASSPSFSDGGDVEDSTVKEESNLDSVASTSDPQLSVKCESSSDEEEPAPLNVKMPQRKGGMQLWQFLYTLLSDPDKKFKELIEWTSNSKAREFRLLEPEAIAIWWGEHKNKRNMSYDKLSRSLRYYYDKGIIRKVSGERYVYQFCLNPELMYQHIGNSKCRPKLKPMPISAKHATSKYQMQHAQYQKPVLMSDPLFIAQGPVSLGALPRHLPSYPHSPSELSFIPPPAMLLHQQQQQIMAEEHMMYEMTGFVQQENMELMRCQSFDSFPYSMPEPKMSFDQHFALTGSSAPSSVNLLENFPYDQSPSLSPTTTSSETSSPTHYSNFTNPLGNSSEIDLDTIIGLTSDGFTAPHSSVSYSHPCDTRVMPPPPSWNY